MRISGFSGDCGGISPVLGSILLLLLVVLLSGIVVTTLYGGEFAEKTDRAFTYTPLAAVSIEKIVGGMPDNYQHQVRFEENYVYLVHGSGDPLDLDSTFIVLEGEGSSYVGQVSAGGYFVGGDIVVTYHDLIPEGLDSGYSANNPCAEDGIWSAGEVLILNGQDGLGNNSSVIVEANGEKTKNNYGFREGTTVTVKVIDFPTQRLISEDTAVVRSAD